VGSWLTFGGGGVAAGEGDGAQAVEGVGGAGAGLQGAPVVALGAVQITFLQVDHRQQVQGVEIVGRLVEVGLGQGPRLFSATALQGGDGRAQGVGGGRLCVHYVRLGRSEGR